MGGPLGEASCAHGPRARAARTASSNNRPRLTRGQRSGQFPRRVPSASRSADPTGPVSSGTVRTHRSRAASRRARPVKAVGARADAALRRRWRPGQCESRRARGSARPRRERLARRRPQESSTLLDLRRKKIARVLNRVTVGGRRAHGSAIEKALIETRLSTETTRIPPRIRQLKQSRAFGLTISRTVKQSARSTQPPVASMRRAPKAVPNRKERHMQVRTRIAARISLLAIAVAAAAVVSGSASAGSDVVGHLYVNDNTAGPNTIAAFDRHADGTLTPLHGSPFAARRGRTGTRIGPPWGLHVTPP